MFGEMVSKISQTLQNCKMSGKTSQMVGKMGSKMVCKIVVQIVGFRGPEKWKRPYTIIHTEIEYILYLYIYIYIMIIYIYIMIIYIYDVKMSQHQCCVKLSNRIN